MKRYILIICTLCSILTIQAAPQTDSGLKRLIERIIDILFDDSQEEHVCRDIGTNGQASMSDALCHTATRYTAGSVYKNRQ